MKIMVTGGAGFIGSHIVEHYKDENVIVFDNLRTGFEKNIKDFNAEFVRASVTDLDELKKWMQGVDYVFHLAALISVPESIQKPEEAKQINTQGTINVLNAAKECKVKKVIFFSSSAIYGDNPELPKIEIMLPEPKSPYAETKLAGEYYSRTYSDEYNQPTAVLRLFNVFGPRQDPDSPYAAVIPIFIKKTLKNEDIVIFGDGEQTRDFVYVKEVVEASVLTVEKGDSIYNVGLGKGVTVNDLAEKIIQLTGSASKIIYQEERAGDVKHSYADISKLKALGFEPSYDFDKALSGTIDYFKAI